MRALKHFGFLVVAAGLLVLVLGQLMDPDTFDSVVDWTAWALELGWALLPKG